MKRIATVMTLCLTTLPTAVSFATSGADRPTVTTLDEVVVTASRQEEKIATVPALVTVVTEADIANSTAQSIPDLLRSEVGVMVRDVTGNGRSYSVDIRGFGETAKANTLVLVDGRRINQPDLSGTDWSLIDLERIKRIEIIRGGRGSVLYGDNAAGGVINIITRDGEEMHGGVKGVVGSYDMYKGSAFLSGTRENLSFDLSGSYRDSDGYRDNSQSRTKDGGANFTYFAGDSVQINLSGDFHKDETGMPGAIKKSEADSGISRRASLYPNDYSEVEDYFFKIGPTFHFGDNSLFSLDGSVRSRTTLYFASFFGGTFTGESEIDTLAVSPQFVLHEKLGTMDNNLTLGIDLTNAQEDIRNTSTFSGEANYRLRKKNFATFVHDELSLLDNLALSAGIRHDQVSFEFAPSTPSQVDMDETLYTAGLNYNYQGNSAIYASFSRSFRYPVLDELFNFFTNTVDTTLVPQTSDDYELGIRQELGAHLTAIVNLFRIDTNDEILYDPNAGMFGANINLDGTTRRDGVEVALIGTFEPITMKATYTYTDATMQSGPYKDMDVPGVPNQKVSLDTVLSLGKGFTVAVNGVYVDERYFESDFANAYSLQDDYLLVNAKLTYQWKHLTAFLDVNNITDEEYSEFGVLGGYPTEETSYPSPKTNFLFGLSMEY